MIDESKTEVLEVAELKGDDTTVTISQEKLNSLINEKFKKGAEKANAKLLETLGVESVDDIKNIIQAKNEADEASKTELQKALDAAEALKKANEELLTKSEKLKEKNRISKLASENKVNDVEYFEFKYSQAKASEDFNESTFIESFTKANPTTPPITDKSPNNGGNPGGKDLKSMSINELKAYQATL